MNIQTVNIHLGSPLASAAILSAIFSSPPPGSVQETKLVPPAIGEVWPSQGGIFVGMGRGRNGAKDHCLILPTDERAIFTERCLGTYGVDVNGASSYHDGMANTVALAESGSDLCKEILALDIDGHKDFYLMSQTEAQLCWANVPEQFKKEWHLTSTQYSSDGAWGQSFGLGYTGYGTKDSTASARACRRLFL